MARFDFFDTALLIGPSVDLPAGQRAAWVRSQIRKARPDFVIAVDGGIRFLHAAPDLVMGDWDSGSPTLARKWERAGARRITLPRHKDFSDLHFALKELPRVRELLLIGFTGGRPDHLLANLLEVASFARSTKVQKIEVIGPEAEYHFLTHTMLPLKLKRKGLVSIFALGGVAKGGAKGGAKGVTTKGFEYGMKNGELQPSSRGLSNRLRARQGEIRVREGILLVVVPK